MKHVVKPNTSSSPLAKRKYEARRMLPIFFLMAQPPLCIEGVAKLMKKHL